MIRIDSMIHRDGVAWHDAPVPRRWHRCRAQTEAYDGGNREIVKRCPCGAITINKRGEKSYWMQRNTASPRRSPWLSRLIRRVF